MLPNPWIYDILNDNMPDFSFNDISGVVWVIIAFIVIVCLLIGML